MYITKHINGQPKELYKLKDPKSHKNKGIELTHTELQMLKFLAFTKVATQKQLYKFYNHKINISESGLKNRLGLFKREGLIDGRPYIEWNANAKKYYYFIKPKGLKVLRNAGYIYDSEFNLLSNTLRYHLYSIRKKKSLDHSIVISEVALNLLGAAYALDKNHVEYGPSSIFPTFQLECGDTIRPDWVIKDENLYINVEVDSGTESRKLILQKAERYYQLAQENPNEKHMIIFVAIDQSIRTKNQYARNRSRRLRSLSHTLSLYTDLDNLDFFVYELKDLLEMEFPFYIMDHFNFLKLKLNSEMGNLIQCLNKLLEKEGIYKLVRAEKINNNYILHLEHVNGITIRDELYVPMIPGDVSAYTRFHKMVEDREEGLLNVDNIIAIYTWEDHMRMGVLPFREDNKKYTNLLLASLNLEGTIDIFKDVGVHNGRKKVDYISVLNQGREWDMDI